MFFFLSLFIQNVDGLQPAADRLRVPAVLVGIVIGAGLSSNLVNRIDPRYIAGVGTLLAAVALFGFSRLSVDESPTPPSSARCRRQPRRRRRELLDLDPAVHRADVGRHGPDVRAADPDRRAPRARRGLRHRLRRAEHHAAGRRRARPGHARARCRCTSPTAGAAELGPAAGAGRRRRQIRGVPGDTDRSRSSGGAAYHGAFTDGATHAFLVGSGDDAARPRWSSGSSSTSSTRSWPPTAPRPRPRRLIADRRTTHRARSPLR